MQPANVLLVQRKQVSTELSLVMLLQGQQESAAPAAPVAFLIPNRHPVSGSHAFSLLSSKEVQL